jgi:mannose-6-phosphate isomerase
VAALADAAAALKAPDADAVASAAAFRAALRAAFTAFMSASEDAVRAATSALAARLAGGAPYPDGALTPDAVANRLGGQFPGDVGVFAPYWLNVLRLQPGEAVFLGANEPHAYLSGDCVEVMACSDNVVRAGLTPKFKDVDTLCATLTYAQGAPTVMTGAAVDAYTRAYTAPVPEFALQRTELPAGGGPYALPPAATACILVVLAGGAGVVSGGVAGDGVAEGQVWLQPAGVAVELTPGPAGVMLYRSMVAQ